METHTLKDVIDKLYIMKYIKGGMSLEEGIKAYQIANGLNPDGIAGTTTLAKMFPETAPTRDLDLPTFDPLPASAGLSWPKQKDCMKFYGGVGLNQTMLVLPFQMRLAWDKRVFVSRISIHEKVHDSAKRAFDRIASAYNADKRRDLGIDLFGGSLNVRKMRGGSSYSMHSWGIAIDFDPERNQLKWGKDRARLAQPDAVEFWRCWEAEGWVALGRARDYDWMHVQAARL